MILLVWYLGIFILDHSSLVHSGSEHMGVPRARQSRRRAEAGQYFSFIKVRTSVTLRVPPLYSETGWTGELWSNPVLLILEN